MTIIYFLLALIALGVLVFIHELGHYFVARLVGMRVEVFSIGFGKPLVQWQMQGVKWQLGTLPFGGFVKIAGMEMGKTSPATKESQKGETTQTSPTSQEGVDGFFSKPPLARIAVVLAGPIANILLALAAFVGLWLAGGREKAFAEHTQLVGSLDTQSELYKKGLRAGDQIVELNGRPYCGYRDLIYASIYGAKVLDLKGLHFKTGGGAFDYRVTPYALQGDHEFKTSGILSSASYLIYDRLGEKDNPLPEGSPMLASGVTYGDRLVWADGVYLFSFENLSRVLNDNKALLTVQRGEKTFLTRQKRVLAEDVALTTTQKNDLMDWSFEAGLGTRWRELYVLPYVFSYEAIVEERVSLNEEPVTNKEIVEDQPLESGDKIIAIDGTPIKNGYEYLKQLQQRKVQLIVAKGVTTRPKTLWYNEDKQFLASMEPEVIDKIAQGIGVDGETKVGSYELLAGITPKKLSEFSSQAKGDNRYALGLPLQDVQVIYNPEPLYLFKNTVVETWQTLKSLVTGRLNPKWLAGPVGIVQVIQQGWQLGVGEALFWIAAISLNLGIFNLLPIPVLDGGYVVLTLWEMITRRRLEPKTLERIIVPFVILLVGMLIFLTFQDIVRFFR